MTPLRFVRAGVPLALLLALDARAAARPDRLPATRVCLDSRRVLDTRVVDDHRIDFVVQSRPERVYRNTLAQRCQDLAVDGSFAVSTPSSFYCEGTPIVVLIAGQPVPGSRCDLGAFVLQPATPGH